MWQRKKCSMKFLHSSPVFVGFVTAGEYLLTWIACRGAAVIPRLRLGISKNSLIYTEGVFSQKPTNKIRLG